MMAGTRIESDQLLNMNNLALEAIVCNSNAMRGEGMTKMHQALGRHGLEWSR